MKIRFNLQDWLSHEVLDNLPLRETDPSKFTGESFQKEIIAENKEKQILSKFILKLKKKRDDNKDLIRQAHIGNNPFPFPELIEIPKVKLLERRIMTRLEKYENREIYCKLLENNNIPVYYSLVKKLSSDYRNDRRIFFSYSVHNGEDYHFDIFQHAIAMCPPSEVQATFDYLADEYAKLDKIDSKAKAESKLEQIRYDFHKSLRNADPLGNPHAEMIIWNILNLSDVGHRAIKTVIDHAKKAKKEKV